MKSLSRRQENILLSLKKLDYLDRDQLRRIHRLGTIRNTNRILSTLSTYLSNFRDGYSTVYYLNKIGREYVNSPKVRKKNSFVHHILMRNDFYIFAGFPIEWKNEMKISDGLHTVVCDSWFKTKGKYHFLEIDRMQKMKENRAKIKQYHGLFQSGLLKTHFGYFPTIIWLTTTAFRKKQLTELCKGLPCVIYAEDDIR